MLKSKKTSIIKNEKGMAIFEAIPIIIVIVLFVNFSLGFFGAIHTGILSSIAARNYTFETFRNRSNLVYFSNITPEAARVEYSKHNMRYHGSVSEKKMTDDGFYAASRLIDFASFDKRAADVVGNEKGNHNKIQGIPEGRNQNIGANPIWIRIGYGICLNTKCGT